jgi:hypothetical protein
MIKYGIVSKQQKMYFYSEKFVWHTKCLFTGEWQQKILRADG